MSRRATSDHSRWRRELGADVLLLLELMLCLSVWGPQSLLWMTLGGDTAKRLSSPTLGLTLALAGIVATATGTLILARKIEHARVRLLMSAGHEAPGDALVATVVALTMITAVIGFIWFFFVQGPGPVILSP